MAAQVLIVEDDLSVAQAIAYTLSQEGFETAIAGDGLTALARFEETQPDLVILDLMLPGISGWQLFAALRRSREVPIIMLTARTEEPDRVAGLEMGADDYVTKPFSMRELVARVRTVLRRSARQDTVETGLPDRGGLHLDPEAHEVLVDDRPVELSPREFDLLHYLMAHAGRVRTRDQIMAGVWGEQDYLDPRTVDVHVRWLRQKIEPDPSHPRRLLTVRGVGYKFVDGP